MLKLFIGDIWQSHLLLSLSDARMLCVCCQKSLYCFLKIISMFLTKAFDNSIEADVLYKIMITVVDVTNYY